jgi:hypothetical protein
MEKVFWITASLIALFCLVVASIFVMFSITDVITSFLS